MFFPTVAFLGFVAAASALPPMALPEEANTPKIGKKGNADIRFPIPDSMTVKQAQAKCGDQAQLSCCNKATYAGDTTDIDSGMLGGVLSNLIGSGSGADGLGLFEQCSTLLPVIPIISEQCKQNIACCQNSPSSANGDLIGLGLPCVALGALL
ncbi:uncharacterized protein PFLUO_LOCUS4151 [Penicillium psychrofluorescens]|uniref:uncharacterized protein n=1 Tax=Penicillium psychrofluorescens TaxID=3158075 RepID=UPI003CCD0BFF